MSKSKNAIFRVLNTTASRIIWSREHDTHLLKLVQLNKGRNWKKIAREMREVFGSSEFSAKKCRERWCNCANPDLDKTALTEVEELFLLLYHYEYKNKWTMISQHLPSRNSTKLKNNFSSLIRKVCRRIQLKDHGLITSMFLYVQILYVATLVHRLVATPQNSGAELLAPVHICEHVRAKGITKEQCMGYIRDCTEEVVEDRKTCGGLRRVALHPQLVQDFLSKLTAVIKAKNLSNESMNEAMLVEIIEMVLRVDGGMALKMEEELSNRRTTSVTAKKEIPQEKLTPAKDIGYTRYQQPANFYENDLLHVPEIQAIKFSALHSPLYFNNDMGSQISAFASPGFQASLHSTQSKYGGSLISPNCFAPVQTMKSHEQFYMMHFQSQPELPVQHKISDFTVFTNKYF